MTRTAPVPNIPAPPGMNPGAFVAGGGGNGGGSGGRGSGNGSGEEGADGADNDENAEGEGNAANACGEGDAGACPNPEHGGGGGLTEGDPVDAISGRVFTTPSVELILRGPLPLVIKRQYSSDAVQRDIGLGYGWSHSLAWRVQVKRRAVLLLQPSGQQRRFRRFDVGQSRTFGRRVLTRSPNAFVLQEGFSRFLFEREAEGSDHYRLAAIEDTFGNRTRLDYNEGRLVGGEDCVGRSFRVVWSGEHIVAFETFETDRKRWKRFFTYGYADGDLTQATDALGNRTTYEYAQHRLVRHTTPTGRTAHFRYDQAGACVECWVDYGDRADPALDADVPEFLADGTTKARGMYHCVFTRDDGYLETVNSRQVKRASTNVFGKADAVVSEGSVSSLQYDDGGNIVSYADGNGATWSWVRDAQGRILEETNPLGESRRYEYNPSGHLLSTTEPDGYRTTQLLDRHGYLLGVSDDEGEIISYEYDARGLCTQAGFPNGGRARMSYDQYGNRAEIIELGGERAYIDYNHFGKPIRHHDGKGKETRFIYDEMLQLICVVNPDGTRQHWSYDADGNLSSLTKPDGAQYQFEWGGVKSTCCVRRPDGTEIHFRYDREGNLVRVINERGEEHRLERDAAGRVVREHTFDGRKLTYTLDLAGNLARIQDHSGAFVDLEYDVLGRVVARTFADDSVETFAYDVRGRLIQATHGESRCEFQYDPRGQLVRQLQALDGVEEDVEAEYDLTGNRTLLRTSRGHEERGAFDVARRMTQLELGHGNDPLRFGYDELDREVSRVLPGGGKILQGFDGMDRLAWREIVWGEEQSKGPEPAWVGARPTQSRRQAFGYDLRGLLAQIMDSAHGATQLSYDRLARVVENSLNGVARESFRYDEVDNVYDAGLARDYAVGGRLLRRGNTSYEYDADGRVVRRSVLGSEAAEWTYEWDARGYLALARAADGSRVEFDYDFMGRRLRKRVLNRFGEITKEVRFVWDRRSLVHELSTSFTEAGTSEEEMTYVYHGRGFAPLAHRRVVSSASRQQSGEWVYYLHDMAYRPQLLMNGKAEVVSELIGSVYGEVTYAPGSQEQTSLRFAGHFFDAETGLHNNHYRHYDPGTGLYLSPEPLGLSGGPRPYAYAANDPIEVIDPDGLAGMWSTASNGTPNEDGTHSGATHSGTGYASGTDHEDNRWRSGAAAQPALNPIVQDALLDHSASLEGARNGRRHPATCAEVRSVSDYLNSRNIGRDSTHQEIQDALNEMQVGANQADNNRPRAPCRNCSQFYARLMARHGAPNPDNIQRGYRSARGNGTPTNFTPPPEGQGYASYQAAMDEYHSTHG